MTPHCTCDQCKKEIEQMEGPYRTAAVMPKEIPLPVIAPPKVKKIRKPFVMPYSIKLFLLLIPICICLAGIGIIYDTTHLQLGLKWGASIGTFLIGAFFVGVAANMPAPRP